MISNKLIRSRASGKDSNSWEAEFNPPILIKEKSSIANVSRLPDPVVADNAAIRIHTGVFTLLRAAILGMLIVVDPSIPGSTNVVRLVKDVGASPIPYWTVHVVERVCTSSNIALKDKLMLDLPRVLANFTENPAPGSKPPLPT